MTRLVSWLAVLAGTLLFGLLPAVAAAPRVTSVTPPSGSLTGAFTELTIVFDQSVNGVDARDLLVNGTPATAVNGSGPVYTFSFIQPNYGGVDVRFASDSAITAANSVADVFDPSTVQLIYTLRDISPPTVLAIHPPEGITIQNFRQVEVTFSEPVAGVKASDLLANGQPAASVSGVSAGPYVFQFPNVVSGPINVRWAGNQAINDLASAPNRFDGGFGWTYTVDANASGADVVISEFLAANATGLKDEAGAVQDWIELHNRGTRAVRLLGWSLTDDPRSPGRWVFPDLTLGAGQFLVVFASGLDRRPAGANASLHTSFRLSRAGEYLGLFNAESPREVVNAFAPNYPEQRNDYSFGLDVAGQRRYFRTPSPGAANGTSGITGVVAPPEFSVQRGFFSSFPFYLTLSTTTPRATIRYSTDGSEPTETKGTVYSDPIFVNGTTIIRAAAFKANALPSLVMTHSYFVNQTIATKSLPVLSIVTATNNLFGPTGIMEFNPRNTTKHGIGWERPASIELIRAEDNSGFQINAGLRVHGGDVVRESYNYNAGPPFGKYSFGLYFRGDYGETSLKYPLFENSALAEFERVGLRAGFNDPLNPFIGDELVRRLMLDMGHVAAHGTFVNLFINGEYKGYYNPAERINSRFLRAWHGGSNDWDVLEQRDNLREGTIDEWSALRAFFATHDLSLPANYQEVSRRLDLTNFVDYVLLHIYAATGDWPGNNWRAARERVPGAKWRFYSWDAEMSFGTFNNARTVDWNEIIQDLEISTRTSAVGDFFSRLRASSEFRLLFADRVQKHFFDGGALTEVNVLYRFEELRAKLLGVLPLMKDTIPRVWVPQRQGIIFMHMLDAGLLPLVSAPTFNQASGPVPLGFNLTMTAPVGQIYYTVDGVDPRVPMNGAVASEARPYNGQPTALTASTTIRARALSGGNWSALSEGSFTVAEIGVPLRLAEIMYNPAGGDAFEFIEVQNVGGTTLDLGGVNFGGIDFRFPDLTALGPGERFLIASAIDPAAFATRYPSAHVNGYYNGILQNGGERITLRDRDGRTITSAEYDDENGWPLQADGHGSSLESLNANGEPSDPANWRASADLGGSPGTGPLTIVSGTVQLNEVMTRNINAVSNAGTYPAWIELHNTAAGPADVGGWRLSNDDNPAKFVFSSGTIIPSQGYLVVWCDTDFAAPGIHTGFFLTNQTESIFLYHASAQRVDAITLGLQLHNQSAGRAGETWQLTSPTPGSDNAVALLAPARELSINEWLANAEPGGDDWIELYNRNNFLPASLRGLWFSVNGTVFQLNSLSFLPPKGYVQLRADENPGIDHLNFKLPAAGAKLLLYDETGQLLDQVEFGPQIEGVSQGRLPDGTSTIMSFPFSPSPGAANYSIAFSGPVLNEVLARNESAATDSAGRFPDWFELFNPTAAAFDLGGMSISIDESQAGQWKFPAGTSIAPNGYLVIWCDPLRAASTSLEAELNCAQRLDGDGGGVSLFNRNDQLVDKVEFGFQLSNQPIGRFGSDWRLLASPTPGAPNSTGVALGFGDQLRLNEWLANPISGDDWFEIYNPHSLPVQLSGLYLTDDPSESGVKQYLIGPLSFIGGQNWVKFVADASPRKGPNHVNFSLDGQGETLRIYSPALQIIDSINFVVQQDDISQGRLPDGSVSFANFRTSASPGERNYLVLPDVVINEVLANASPPFEQAIEIYNSSPQPVNIGGWYLSNDGGDLKKFRINDGTILLPRGFKVFYESQFNAAPGTAASFRLSAARGGNVRLAATDPSGNLNNYQAVARFGSSQNNVSIGRHVTSVDADFVPLTGRTFGVDKPISVDQFRTGSGAPNGPPKFGPMIISEVMYHPISSIGSGGVEEPDDEFIELQNPSSSPVLFFDPAHSANRWELRGDVEFRPPDTLIIQPKAFLLIVGFDPAASPTTLEAFKAKYTVPEDVRILGPFASTLSNEGALVELSKPESGIDSSGPDAGVVPYVLVDRIKYRNQSPWPFDKGDSLVSLQRQSSDQFGNDPANWRALPPTAGRTNKIAPISSDGDTDGDGLPDLWETVNGLNLNDPTDADADVDGDGYTNFQEYLTGTDPQDPASQLQFTRIGANPGGVIISFTAAAGKTYTVQFTDDLASPSWQTLEDVDVAATSQTVEVTDSFNPSGKKRFYRLVAPKQ